MSTGRKARLLSGACALGWLAALGVAGIGVARTWLADNAANRVRRDVAELAAAPAGATAAEWEQRQQALLADRRRQLDALVRWRPDVAANWRLRGEEMAEDHPGAARASLRRAVAAVPTDWQSWLLLAQLRLAQGDIAGARAALGEAQRWNQGFEASYELANFDLILGDTGQFWQQATIALRRVDLVNASAREEVDALLATAARQAAGRTSDPARLLARAPNAVRLEAAKFYIAHAQPRLAELALARVAAGNTAERRAAGRVALRLSEYWLRQATSTGAPANAAALGQARALWDQAVKRDGLSGTAARPGELQAPCFQQPWLGQGFGWRDARVLYAAPVNGGGLEVNFSALLYDRQDILDQWVLVDPGSRYRLAVTSQHRGPGAAGGPEIILHAPGWTWRLPLATGRRPQHNQAEYQVPAGVNLVRLAIGYRRPLGALPIRGRLRLGCLSLTPVP